MSVLAATPGCVNPDIGDETPSFSHPSMQFPVRSTRKAFSLPCWCVQRYVGQWRCGVCVCVCVAVCALTTVARVGETFESSNAQQWLDGIMNTTSCPAVHSAQCSWLLCSARTGGGNQA
jgi:hypothetical protein